MILHKELFEKYVKDGIHYYGIIWQIMMLEEKKVIAVQEILQN